MPMVIPIIAAAGSIAAGAAAFAAATTVAGMVVGGLMIAGGALTILGTLTGNQSLSKWGGILSLAGGIGSIASNIAAGTAQEVARQAAEEGFRASEITAQNAAAAGAGDIASGAASAAAPAATAGADAAASTPGPASTGPAAVDQAPAPGAATDTPGLVDNVWDKAGPGEGGPWDSGAAETASKSPVQELLKDTPPADTYTGDPAGVSGRESSISPQSNSGVSPDGTATGKPTAPTGKSGTDWFDRASKWVENNKTAAKIGADTLKGAADAYSRQDAIKSRFRMEEEARQRERDRYNASVRSALTQNNNPYGTYQPPKG